MALTDEQMWLLWNAQGTDEMNRKEAIAFARAIESAATAPLLERIAELEQRNRDLYEDVQRFKKHALNEKEARMALERELACERSISFRDQVAELEQQLSEAREDAERLDWLTGNPVDALDLFGRVTGDFTNWPKWIRGDIDAAMKGQQ